MSAEQSAAAAMVRSVGTVMPASFNEDGQLFAANLFLMTAFTCFGWLMARHMLRQIWGNRSRDLPRHPVTIWRLGWLLAGLAVFLHCGAEALNLWAWNPRDAVTTARVLMAKRWIDPLALCAAGAWMLLVLLANKGMQEQLSKRPYPIKMWASTASLRRPLAVVLLSLIAAVGVSATR